MRKRQMITIITGLCVFDQIIKLVIQHVCFDVHLSIFGDWLGFYPIINTKQSWGGTFLPFLSNPIIAISLNIFLMIIIHSMYVFYTKSVKPSKLYNSIYLLFMAGSICSLIDKLCWGGSLDYVAFLDWFIFDVKDCYLSFAICLLLTGSFLQPVAFDTKAYVCDLKSKVYKTIRK